MNSIMIKCNQRALAMGDNLFPQDCISILEAEYKQRLELMKPLTIFNKVKSMMELCFSDMNYDEEIIDSVNSYIGYL